MPHGPGNEDGEPPSGPPTRRSRREARAAERGDGAAPEEYRMAGFWSVGTGQDDEAVADAFGGWLTEPERPQRPDRPQRRPAIETFGALDDHLPPSAGGARSLQRRERARRPAEDESFGARSGEEPPGSPASVDAPRPWWAPPGGGGAPPPPAAPAPSWSPGRDAAGTGFFGDGASPAGAAGDRPVDGPATPAASPPTASTPTVSGPAASGPAGSGPTGSGPKASTPTGSTSAASTPAAAQRPGAGGPEPGAGRPPRPESLRSEPGRPGSGRSESGRSGSGGSGSGGAEQVLPEPGGPASGQPGSGRPGLSRPGSVRPEPVRPEPVHSDSGRPDSGRPASDRSAPDRPAAGRPAPDRPAPDRPAPDRSAPPVVAGADPLPQRRPAGVDALTPPPGFGRPQPFGRPFAAFEAFTPPAELERSQDPSALPPLSSPLAAPLSAPPSSVPLPADPPGHAFRPDTRPTASPQLPMTPQLPPVPPLPDPPSWRDAPPPPVERPAPALPADRPADRPAARRPEPSRPSAVPEPPAPGSSGPLPPVPGMPTKPDMPGPMPAAPSPELPAAFGNPLRELHDPPSTSFAEVLRPSADDRPGKGRPAKGKGKTPARGNRQLPAPERGKLGRKAAPPTRATPRIGSGAAGAATGPGSAAGAAGAVAATGAAGAAGAAAGAAQAASGPGDRAPRTRAIPTGGPGRGRGGRPSSPADPRRPGDDRRPSEDARPAEERRGTAEHRTSQGPRAAEDHRGAGDPASPDQRGATRAMPAGPRRRPEGPTNGPDRSAPRDEPASGPGPRRPARPPVPAEAAAEPSPGRAGRNLPAAIAVGVVLAVVALASLFTRPEAFVALVSFVVVLAVWELAGAMAAKQVIVPVVPLAVGSLGMLVSAYVAGEEGLLVSFALTSFGVLLWRIIDGAEGAARDVTAGLFTAAYVPLLAGFAILLLRGAEPDGPKRVAVFILVTVMSDIGGYAAGVLFGKTPMAPRISPKKSWEGFGGSVVACVLVATAAVVLLLDGPWWVGVLLGAATAVTATLGDLSESLIKRDLGVKDMGSLLPGHGGIMDRLDSLLPSAPIAFLILHWMSTL
jgi:phosphatidate cytidylyltransferase